MLPLSRPSWPAVASSEVRRVDVVGNVECGKKTPHLDFFDALCEAAHKLAFTPFYGQLSAGHNLDYQGMFRLMYVPLLGQDLSGLKNAFGHICSLCVHPIQAPHLQPCKTRPCTWRAFRGSGGQCLPTLSSSSGMRRHGHEQGLRSGFKNFVARSWAGITSADAHVPGQRR